MKNGVGVESMNALGFLHLKPSQTLRPSLEDKRSAPQGQLCVGGVNAPFHGMWMSEASIAHNDSVAIDSL